jgi:PAS domain S-box-containing protein
MKLSEFIRNNIDAILQDWEQFAGSIQPKAGDMNKEALLDHAKLMLEDIAAGLDLPEGQHEQAENAKGRSPTSVITSAAEKHGLARFASGFSITDLVSEYRALRASAIRLWGEFRPREALDSYDLIRFNEAIDKDLYEALGSFFAENERKTLLFDAVFSSSAEGFALHEIICGVDGKPVDYRYLEINPAFERLTGLSRETVIGKTAREVLPGIEDYWIESFGRVALDGTPAHFENYSAPLNRWYEVYSHQVAPGKFAVFFTDITERKQAQGMTIQQMACFPEQNPNPVLRCSPGGIIMYTNMPAAQWLATLDLQADDFDSLPDSLREAVSEACRHGHTVDVEFTNPAGRTFGISIIQPPEQDFVHLYAIDLTDRKQAQEARERSNRELIHQLRKIEELNQSLKTANRLLEEKRLEVTIALDQVLHAGKLSAIGQLSASIAHEFNNPLQGIMSILKGLKRRAILEEEDKELLDMAIAETERMKNLIRSLQDFNRPSSGKKIFMDVHASIDSLLLLCKGDFKRKNISVVLDYDKRLPHILAIPDQIKQVFLNLLNNAADACLQNGGVITISTCHDEERVAVAIKDNCMGIEPEKMDLIFQPFYSTKSAAKGTGLGLSVCHGIIQNHQGEIRVESQPEAGSTFTVLLPINVE